jgi:Nucleotidyl transferase AbiEii toxin, Type IV TA system
MPAPDKPRHRSGYKREETEQVISACLTVAVTLGALMEHLCIVGGLVPSLIIDRQLGPDPDSGQGHPGTNDLDVGLAIALLDDQRYAEISRRLRQEDFKPDVNDKGNPTPQRWTLRNLKVAVDFLLPAIPGAEQGGRVQPLERDFGALIAPGLELAFDERQEITIEGHTLTGEKATRMIPVCGPATFVVLKALALGDRGEPKDAYDLVYVLRRWPAGIDDIAARLATQAANHRGVIKRAVQALASDFAGPDSIGPLRAARFDGQTGDDLDAAAADAHGYVDDLLRACHVNGLAMATTWHL